MLYPKIREYCSDLSQHYDEISEERKALLTQLAAYISEKIKASLPVNLVYICTHNSRRSHFGQVWARVSAVFYGFSVNTFSGGTEATAFNANAIKALQAAGLRVETNGSGNNPLYRVYFDEDLPAVDCFSKVYDHPANPARDFAAVMTCGEAEQNCPFIPGAELRIATTYEDPKAFDGTPEQDAAYNKRCRQIALESLFVFSLLKKL